MVLSILWVQLLLGYNLELHLLDYEHREAFLGEQILRHTLQVGCRERVDALAECRI